MSHPRWIMSLEVEVEFGAPDETEAWERAEQITANAAAVMVGRRAPAGADARSPGSATVYRVGMNQEDGAVMPLGDR